MSWLIDKGSFGAALPNHRSQATCHQRRAPVKRDVEAVEKVLSHLSSGKSSLVSARVLNSDIKVEPCRDRRTKTLLVRASSMSGREFRNRDLFHDGEQMAFFGLFLQPR